MRKSMLSNALVLGLAELAAQFGTLGESMHRAAFSTSTFGGFIRKPSKRRNRTDSAKNRGVAARRKANKVARHARVFNAQRARA